MKKVLLLSLIMSLILPTFSFFPAFPFSPTLSARAENSSGVWMYAVSIGKADAILIGADGHAALIDTGYSYSRGRILAALDEMGVSSLDGVFITHLDGDHIGGLTWLAESDIPIGAWYSSAMYLDVDNVSDHPAAQAAALRGDSVTFLQAGDAVSLGSAVLRVLAPLEKAGDKDDNNSLVMMLESAEGRILLTGDIEYPAERLLLNSGADLSCDVLKVANHADDDTNSPAFTAAASPQIAVISTSTAEKEDTPDPSVVRLLENQGAQVFVTQDCTGGILVRLSGGKASAEYINVPESSASVTLLSAEPKADLITLANTGSQDTDLGGWYLYSTRGKEMYVFPSGTIISSGETLTVGTLTSDKGTYDLLWNEKKVVHKKKDDTFLLYDSSGTLISMVSNNL